MCSWSAKASQFNRKRPQEQRLPFRSQYRIARPILVELASPLPKGWKVVVFARLQTGPQTTRFCVRQAIFAKVQSKSNWYNYGEAPTICSTEFTFPSAPVRTSITSPLVVNSPKRTSRPGTSDWAK